MGSNFSKKISKKEKSLILKYLGGHQIKPKSDLVETLIKTKNYVLTIYKNQTLLIQGTNFENVLKMLDGNNISIAKTTSIKIDNNIIGSDESGNGDFFGGVSVCACFIEPDKFDFIKALGVKDSKELCDQEMQEIVDEIKANVSYELAYISPYEYNQLFNQYQNINTIKTILHERAVNALASKHQNATIVIDQYCNESAFQNHLKLIDKKINNNLVLETKAENKYLQVAASSIIARCKFIEELGKLSEQLEINLPLGSVDGNVLPVLKQIKNRDDLNKFCKTHFKTFSKI